VIIRTENAPDMAAMITRTLEPDNLNNIITEYKDDSVTTIFISEKIGNLIATIDDYLMNAKIANDMITAIRNDNIDNKEDDI
jgi:hypothetical protein